MARKSKTPKPNADEAKPEGSDPIDDVTDAVASEIEDAEVVSETPPPGQEEGGPGARAGADDAGMAEEAGESNPETEQAPEEARDASSDAIAEGEKVEDALTDTDTDTGEEKAEPIDGEVTEETPVAGSSGEEQADAEPEETRPVPIAANAAQKPAYAAVAPLVLGGAVAAFIGFAASNVMHERRANDALSPEDNAAAIEALESGVAGQAARIDGLEAVDPAQIAADAVAPVIADVQSLSERLDALSGEFAALTERVETIAMRPTATGIEADEFDAALSEFRDQLNAAISNAQTEIVEAREEASRISEEAFSAEQAAVLRGAWAQVTGALQNGGPFAEPLAAVREIAEVELPPALATTADGGVPTLSDIQQAFPEAARAALEASIRSDKGEAPLERFTAFLRVQSGVRSLTPREGDDPDAVLSRVEAALRSGDLAAALGEAEALPEEGRASLSDWISLASTRLEATQAASELSSSLSTN